MSTHKHIDRICVVITLLSLLITVLFMNGEAFGLTASARVMGYEKLLFDSTRVHTVDIVIDDWDTFLETAANEEYTVCSVVIDNEAVKNVAIRGKGNTSLSTVASMGSSRYSFKLEFDHYESGKTYKGLDKLCLNNLIQDNSYMKDYLAYRLMNEFGADAPLCSYIWVTVNGEDWGLYLAVEAVEDSFMQRVYGGEGDLYKPDSMSMGGGPGNGRDFNMDEFLNGNTENTGIPQNSGAAGKEGEQTQPPQQQENEASSGGDEGVPSIPGQGGFPQMPGQNGGAFPGRPEQGGGFPAAPGGTEASGGPGNFGGGPGGFGMGSGDVALQYSNDTPESYPNIFDNAKSDVTAADKARLIRSLKSLSEGENLEDVLDIDELLRYFVVHNYLVNGDSYTGAMVHNYYLHEADGRLSMVPWDYNLAFGTFQAGDAAGAVNDPIDTPLSVSGDGSRPMADWIFRSEEYTALYHQCFADFLDSVDISSMIDETRALIAPYVEKDPTAFCSFAEFETGVEALKTFCEKRTESVRRQLDGTIPTTDAGQQADPSALVDASGLTLSDMGSMGGGEGGPSPGGNPFGEGGPGQNTSQQEASSGGGEASSAGGGNEASSAGDEASSGGGEAPAAPSAQPSAQPSAAPAEAQTPPQNLPEGFTLGERPDMPGTAPSASASLSWPMLLVSAAFLLGGILTALLYKRRK